MSDAFPILYSWVHVQGLNSLCVISKGRGCIYISGFIFGLEFYII